jgi:nucleotide-binding universal stress UspA family protein
MNTIVVPLDGSTLSEHALPYARAAAQLFDAELQLVQVVPTPLEPMFVESVPLRAAVQNLPEERNMPRQVTNRVAYEQAEGCLFSHAARLRERGLHTSTEVRMGMPDEEIVSAALQHNATMIVMATHGRSGLRRWTLGSVADKVVRSSPIPVLLIPATCPIAHEWTIRRILVPWDGSELAARALPLVREMAARTHAEIVLVQAVDPLSDIETHWVPVAGDIAIIRRNEALEQLKDITDDLSRNGLRSAAVAILSYPSETILEEAIRQHADLIIMATHGYGGMRRVALGSVADRVLHATTTPLLLVHPADA